MWKRFKILFCKQEARQILERRSKGRSYRDFDKKIGKVAGNWPREERKASY